jgi:chitinase
MKSVKFFLFVVLSTILFSACSSDDDKVAPVVTINSPDDNATFNSGDIIVLQAVITDDKKLVSVNISSNLGINETVTTLDSDVMHNANYNLTLDPATPAGTYDITVSAVDDDGESGSDMVSITIQ